MKPYILPGIVFVLIILVIGAIIKGVFFKPANAGLKVEAFPSASVFLDGKSLGKTPFEDEKLSPGEKTLKLVPDSTDVSFSPWETKIKLVGGMMTVVKRVFGETEGKSSGEIVFLEKITDKKTASLLVVSIPDSAVVKINGESRGFTPFSLDKLTEGDQEIVLSAPSFLEETVRTKLIAGYKTTVNVKLAESSLSGEGTESLTPTPTATPSGKLTPTPKSTAKPTSNSSVNPDKPYVEIKETPTGWLRVRADPKTNSAELARVNPGEKYPLLDEQVGWYRIAYADNKEGWVSSQYCQKFE